jgi:hypothetical protein
MQLILAIDGDPRRSEQLASVVRARLTVDLVQATSAGEGLHALKDQIPDLILTAPLLSPFDDGVLDEYLRDLGAAGAHVQTVRIPVLSAAPKKRAFAKTLFSLARTEVTSPAAPDGCDPKVFADEIALYLSRAAEARKTIAHIAQASPRQEEAPPAPPSPVIAHTQVRSEALIDEFSDAIDLSYTDIAAPPRYVAAAEPPRYVAAAEPWHDMVSEPSHVEEIESSRIDDNPDTAPPILETMPDAEHVTPEPARTVPGTSATFEAALAAIRAAWVKPDAPATGASSATAAAPRSASRGEVDLTNTIDTLEDVGGRDHDSEADDHSSPVSPSTPPGQHKADKPKTRPEKARGRKMEASEGRLRQDHWGVFDPGQRGRSALVDKLDEVAAAEEAPKRTARIFSIG